MLRSAIAEGDLSWEARLLAAHHILDRTPSVDPDDPLRLSEAWAAAHQEFHQALLDGCANRRLRLIAAGLRDEAELYRRWSLPLGDEPDRDVAAEHRAMLEAALARDAEAADAALREHIEHTTRLLLSGNERISSFRGADLLTRAKGTRTHAATHLPDRLRNAPGRCERKQRDRSPACSERQWRRASVRHGGSHRNGRAGARPCRTRARQWRGSCRRQRAIRSSARLTQERLLHRPQLQGAHRRGLSGARRGAGLPEVPGDLLQATHNADRPRRRDSSGTRRSPRDSTTRSSSPSSSARAGRRIPAERAAEHIFGYTIGNDVSAREVQQNHGQWFLGKAMDTALSAGPGHRARARLAERRRTCV